MPLLLLIFFGLYGWIEFEAFILVGKMDGGLVTFFGHFHHSFHWHGSDETAGCFNSAALAGESEPG